MCIRDRYMSLRRCWRSAIAAASNSSVDFRISRVETPSRYPKVTDWSRTPCTKCWFKKNIISFKTVCSLNLIYLPTFISKFRLPEKGVFHFLEYPELFRNLPHWYFWKKSEILCQGLYQPGNSDDVSHHLSSFFYRIPNLKSPLLCDLCVLHKLNVF